ncbi:MAG: hypothetical protein COU98_01665 [Candidatus Staskawiczbacteria bacterium CG10_big_fil_rev_8_21_14_0_10_38_10]|uniref:POTRA domain-containing protein n=1 Tax=Candidatus Staskawiczbacteria bacterium CG10_big_fil_rev_8_21_14_0_10_38_10 TaxID=1974891 RepID=A0A2H9T1E4_9BACT|nr:MAG: hypothetical protein COU98_01665 [Candidatus Staskawiczbacteria bacterium CG10_big_fil_rev_8_21_14_0_10_38_10]
MKRVKKKVFRLKQRKTFIKSRFFWFVILFLIFLGTVFYFSIFFDKFQVSQINISGNEKVSTNVLQNMVSDKISKKLLTIWVPAFLEKDGKLVLNSKSIFLVNKGKIAKEVLINFPEIESVKIEKRFPNRLFLEFKERKELAIFCQKDQCFSIDKNGIIFEKRETVPDNEMVISFSDDISNLLLGRAVADENALNLLTKIKEDLMQYFQIEIKKATFSIPEKLEMQTNENWWIIFNLKSDVDLQITKLNLLLKEEITPEIRENLKYIDLRFTKAYYK